MRSILALPALALLALLPSAAPGPAAKLVWEASYEEARATAAEEGRVVFVAVDHAEEGRSEAFLRTLMKDKLVLELAELTLNVPASTETHGKGKACTRFKGLGCEDHRRSAAGLREGVLLANDVDVTAAPQYLWLDGEGKVLLSVPYELDRDGLLWCFATALRLVNPETAPPLPEEARPPRRLLMGRAFQPIDGDTRGRGMTPDELELALEGTKSNLLGLVDVAAIVEVMFTDEEAAVDYVRVQLSFVLETFARRRLPQTLRTLGDISPPRFWEAVEEFAETEDTAARHEVPVALEQLGSPDALKLVKAGLKREQDELVERAWVRALAACGPADKNVRKTLLKLLDEDEAPAMRATAAFALGYLRRDAEVRAAWRELLTGGVPSLRIAAACGVALARDLELLPELKVALAGASEEDRPAFERAVAVLEGGDLYPLAEDVAAVTGDELPRVRIFFAGEVPVPDGEG